LIFQNTTGIFLAKSRNKNNKSIILNKYFDLCNPVDAFQNPLHGMSENHRLFVVVPPQDVASFSFILRDCMKALVER